MDVPIFQVDAFATPAPFSGNPAAVCPLETWLSDELMQAIASENNLSETAFFVPTGDGYHLRWFTPAAEVDLCGHATLASGFVVAKHLDPDAESVRFDSRSGPLTVELRGERLVLDFPTRAAAPRQTPAGLADVLGVEPVEVRESLYTMVVLESEGQVRELSPDPRRLGAITPALIVTAPGEDCDFVSRFFAPGYGVDEDPVTGSAHCVTTPYWSQRLDQKELFARQLSARGGELWCEDAGARTRIGGRARLYLEGRLRLE